jgi:flagellar capping protein FliD
VLGVEYWANVKSQPKMLEFLTVKPMSRDLLEATDNSTAALQTLVLEVRNTVEAIKQIRENLALLTTTVKEATAQAKESAKSASVLAKSLNRITFMLVIVGLIQVVVTLIITWHH